MTAYKVTKTNVCSGPSKIKKYWTLYKDGTEIGSISEGFMCEIGALCSGVFITRKYACQPELYTTMVDAITKGLGITGTVKEIDEICDLFFAQDFHLALSM